MSKSIAIALVTLVLSAACDDKETDPCPQITAGGDKKMPVVSTGSAPVPTGGALVSGIYNLTSVDLVLAADIGAEARVQCESVATTTLQQTLRVVATSPSEGTLVSLSISDDGNGVVNENRSSASYVSAGTALTVTVTGTVCDTSHIPQVDGGIADERVLSEPEAMPLSRPYSSSATSLAFYATLAYSGATDCVLVSTYTKQ